MKRACGYAAVLSCLLLTTIIVTLFTLPANAQFENLQVRVGDTLAYPGMQNSEISVYYRNYIDSCYGFMLTLVLDRPDIMEFGIDLDTIPDTFYWRCLEYDGENCVDSINVTSAVWGDSTTEYDWISIDTIEIMVGNVETEGTLIEGWETVRVQYLVEGDSTSLRITALADYGDPSHHTSGIPYPQTTNSPLIKLRADVFCIPSEETDRIANINIVYFPGDVRHFIFYDENMEGICTIQDSIADTTWYQCQNWIGDSCTDWVVLPDSMAGSADSFSYDWHQFLRLDTSDIDLHNGTLEVYASSKCGDVNCDGYINILDINYLVQYLYNQGPAPEYISSADVNCSGSVNILDINYLTNYLYNNGPAPCANCK
ncbi:MAG: dockerin type I repeat-containing protein [Candidatus Zixiibacteriota bacterium]